MLGLRGPEIRLLLLIQTIPLFLLPLDLSWLLHAHERMALLAGARVALHLAQMGTLSIHQRARGRRLLCDIALSLSLRSGKLHDLVCRSAGVPLHMWVATQPSRSQVVGENGYPTGAVAIRYLNILQL